MRAVVPPMMIALALVASGAELKLRASDLGGRDNIVANRISHDAATATTRVLQLRATDLQGNRWTAEQLRGRVVLIDFWATWCAPCLSELPRLKKLRERYTRDEFEILGVMLDASSRRTIVSWLNRNRIDWPQIHERGGYNGPLTTSFGVRQLPATVLIDADTRVVGIDLRGDALLRRIEELVNQQ